mgnify:FL=1|tara:strand:- start:5123 stop:6328 length:1206 start_codon:yes stop_codon:yes gene_type:complete
MSKRILLLIPSLSETGGAENLALRIGTALAEKKNNIFIATFDKDPMPRQLNKADQVRYFYLGNKLSSIKLPTLLKPLNYIYYFIKLSCLIKKLQIDITVSILWKADLINSITFARTKRVSLSVINYKDNPVNLPLVKYKKIIRFLYKRFDRVLAINNALKEELKELFQINPSKISSFNNFIEDIPSLSTFDNSKKKKYIFCGRLSPEKNLINFLYSWAAFVKNNKDCQLVVLGDGHLRKEVELFLKNNNISFSNNISNSSVSVIMLGMVKKPEEYISNSHCFILPSTDEGTPTVLLIAMFLGIPIIASDTRSGGVKDMFIANEINEENTLIKETEAGMILPIPDINIESSVSAWTDALNKINNIDKNNWDIYSKGSKKLSLKYTKNAFVDEWESLVQNLFK